MKNNFKVFGLLTLLLLSIAVVPAVSAVDFVFDNVEINGDDVDLSNPETFAVERGQTLDLHVVLHAENAVDDVDDLRLRTWIGGYEYDLIDDKTEIFKLSNSGSKKAFDLSLEIPEDLDVEDDDYTLHLEVLNHNIELTIPLSVEIEKTRHKLSIRDVVVSPSTPEAGETVFVSVRLENMGDTKEEDIKVEVSALGVSAETWMSELFSVEDDHHWDQESSGSSRPLVLRLPADVTSGEYDFNVKVTYNRGHSTVESVKAVYVSGSSASAHDYDDAGLQAVVSVDTTAQSVAQGDETVYKLTFANMGDKAQLFSANVAGAQLWADARVDPAFVSVGAGQTGEMYVYVKAHEDASLGNHLFTLQLLAGDDLVKELPLGARVTENAQSSANASVGDGLLSNSTLKLGFVGLIVLLVIVGLVVALRKLKDDDEYPLEPKDGQTYY